MPKDRGEDGTMEGTFCPSQYPAGQLTTHHQNRSRSWLVAQPSVEASWLVDRSSGVRRCPNPCLPSLRGGGDILKSSRRRRDVQRNRAKRYLRNIDRLANVSSSVVGGAVEVLPQRRQPLFRVVIRQCRPPRKACQIRRMAGFACGCLDGH